MPKSNLPEVVKREVATKDAIEAPALILEAGSNAKYAWEEFIYGKISNLHTRRAYGKALFTDRKCHLALSPFSLPLDKVS